MPSSGNPVALSAKGNPVTGDYSSPEGRYKATLVDRDSYLLEGSWYMVLNPVRAGMVNEPEAWPWSGYLAMVAAHASEGCSYQQINAHFGVHFTTLRKWCGERREGVIDRHKYRTEPAPGLS